MPLRILLASQTYLGGNGQAVFTIHLAESLVQAGHQVTVVTPGKRLRSSRETVNGVRVEALAALHLKFLHPALYLAVFPPPRIKRMIREFKPEIVHIQDHYPVCGIALSQARAQHIPAVGTNHFLPENILPFLTNYPRLQNFFARPMWVMMLAVFNRLNKAVTPSKVAADILRTQDIHVPVFAISNGIDTSRFRPDPEADRAGIRRKYGLSPDLPLLLYVGRLDHEKRLDVLVDAFSRLPRSDVQLAIAGFGIYETALRRQVQAKGIQDRVVFTGYVPPEDLPSLYNSADLFIMPSPEELQSIASLEAIACGKPVLAANARALPELVAHGVNGYLFRPNDSQDAAHWMEEFLQSPNCWEEMGKASVQRAASHSIENTIRQYTDLYCAAIAENRAKVK